MFKRLLLYLGIIVVIALMSTGPVLFAYGDNPLEPGRVFWLMLPTALILGSCLLLTWKVWIPKLLLKDRILLFFAALFGTSYMIPFLTFAADYFVRRAVGLTLHGFNYLSPWILVYALIVSLINMLMLSAISIPAMRGKWKRQNRRLIEYEKRLSAQIKRIHDTFDSLNMFGQIDRIIEIIPINGEKAYAAIMEFSKSLRYRLYEQNEPTASTVDEDVPERETSGNRLIELLTSRRLRWARHLALQLFLLITVLGPAFTEFDKPDFSVLQPAAVAVMYVFLNMIVYGNIYLLLPLFLKRLKIKQYFVSVFLVTAAIIALLFGLLCLQSVSEEGSYTPPLPNLIMIFSTVNSTLELTAYSLGTAVMVIVAKWLRNNLIISRLRVETARCRLEFLKKQINPHFLFNTLNNAGITGYDDPVKAVMILTRLRDILSLQVRDTEKPTTTIGEELTLLGSYLELEQTRKQYLNYTITVENIGEECVIPTLLLIPFVENAVKYYDRKAPGGEIAITLRAEGGWFCFECRNPYDPTRAATTATAGGLGIANTRCRLDLLFSGQYKFSTVTTDNQYIIKLSFPIKHEVYYSR